MLELQSLLGRLEKTAGLDVVVCGWSGGINAGMDPDRRAATEVQRCVELPRRDGVILLVAGRGGTASFADAAMRALRTAYDRIEVVVLSDVSAAGTLLALGAHRCYFAPNGALGAYDAGPQMPGPSRLTPREFDDVPAMMGIDLGGNPGFQARLAHMKHEARVARNLAERWLGDARRSMFSTLSVHELGDSLALDHLELDDPSFAPLPEAWRRDVEEIQNMLEARLHADGKEEAPRYTASGIGEEVEFEPAEDIVVGLIASGSFESRFVVDSGRPHPETGVYVGIWINGLA